jgi:hypothetical protein
MAECGAQRDENYARLAGALLPARPCILATSETLVPEHGSTQGKLEIGHIALGGYPCSGLPDALTENPGKTKRPG